jgi:hypothetical protein
MKSSSLYYSAGQQKTVKVAAFELKFFYFLHFAPLFQKKARVSSGRQWPAGPDAHQELRAGEQHMQPMRIFGQATVHGLTIYPKKRLIIRNGCSTLERIEDLRRSIRFS